MSTPEEFTAFKSRLDTVRQKLDTVSPTEWAAYIKVRDILLSMGVLLVDEEETLESDSAKEASVSFKKVVRCAMVGIFEPAVGSGAVGGYDAGAVQRFADLGG